VVEIRASHAAWTAEWATKRAHNPHSFIPHLWRWFRDGDWKNPPALTALGKPMESQRRKSRIEEAIDRA
jgi:hypothetical protein